jgi:hypothetical protein
MEEEADPNRRKLIQGRGSGSKKVKLIRKGICGCKEGELDARRRRKWIQGAGSGLKQEKVAPKWRK